MSRRSTKQRRAARRRDPRRDRLLWGAFHVWRWPETNLPAMAMGTLMTPEQYAACFPWAARASRRKEQP